MPRSSRSWCDTADWLRPQHRGEIAHAQLAVRQGIENAHAGRIAERAERVGQALHGVRRYQLGADLPDAGEVDLDEVANFIFEHMSKCSYISRRTPCQGLGAGE